MMPHGVIVILTTFALVNCAFCQCQNHESQTFVRWSGMSPEQATPVFVYSASGDEESLTGACLARCRELEDCAAVIVAYTRGNCQGIARSHVTQFKADNDAAFFTKVCVKMPEACKRRWWSLESTPGYYLNSESPNIKVIQNTTIQECYNSIFSTNEKKYRSAQWIDPDSPLDTFAVSDNTVGNCILNVENRFTEPESYRVSNFYTFYIENQCGHDYPKKIDRCSYEEYYNQTLRHVDLTFNNLTKNECKSACESESRFVCRGFTWRAVTLRGVCDLHSEDLVTTGSWLLRRVSGATYYRRVICLNISVECEASHLVVTYKPRGMFRGRVYVPGRGERCGARALAASAPVRLALPLYGDCDVNFAYAISKGPGGLVNRTMAYVMLMIQSNPIIQTAGDRWVRVGCSPGAGARGYTKVDATVAVQDSGRPSLASESSNEEGNRGASAVFGGASPISVYIVRTHEENGPAAVSLGEPLELRVETTEESEIEAYHLVASSRLGDSSVLLLDNKGCPTGQVDFPSFSRSREGGVQRLSARFKAFRFPSSHVVRFALMVRYCDHKCAPVDCKTMEQLRSIRDANDTNTNDVIDSDVAAAVQREVPWQAQVDAAEDCGRSVCAVPLELQLEVGARDAATDSLVRADHRSALPEDSSAVAAAAAAGMVCVHELLLVALLLAWLAVQVLLLLGCCVLVKRYRNLAEMSMQKDYHSFDNAGFDTSTHRRVHWPDQSIDIIHAT